MAHNITLEQGFWQVFIVDVKVSFQVVNGGDYAVAFNEMSLNS